MSYRIQQRMIICTGQSRRLCYSLIGHLLQSIFLRRIAMHHKAPRSCSATCIAKHFRLRGSPLTRLPREGGEGAKRRAGWKGSKGKKGSLALNRLFHPVQVARRSSFVLPVRRTFTYIFEAPPLVPPSLSTDFTLNLVFRFLFTFCVPLTSADHDRRKLKISQSTFLVGGS